MIILRRSIGVLTLLILLGGVQIASSQTIVNWQVETGNWDSVASWDDGFSIPDTEFEHTANISNGGTATVNNNISPSPGRIVLGQDTGQTGNLIIANGGVVAAELFSGNVTVPAVIIGGDGIGHLTVQSGGSIAGHTLIVGGELVDMAGSSLTVGAATGAAANINIGTSTTISREARIIGPNVNFVSPAFNLYSTSVFIPEITAANHSAINVSGNVFLDNGVLRPEFSNGVVPTVGDTWNLFDAGSISGQFTIDTSAAPALTLGQSYRFSSVPNASNGVFGQLTLKQLLVLNINRTDGSVSIVNGPTPIDIVGYSVLSGLGGLKPSGWNSLQDQNNSDWRESPQGGSVNALSELKPTGPTSVTAASPLSLGAIFQLPTVTEFGTEIEDITFEYFSAEGEVTQGIVNYTGEKQHNNLVLLVDPATGDARMENQSPLTVNIQNYRITSAAESLLDTWDSLEDQGAAGGDWEEANTSAGQLAELKFASSTTMSQGSGFNFSGLFNVGSTEDLAFQFLFPGEDELRTGIVEYRSFDEFSTADFNEDTLVDGDDLAAWQSAYGSDAGGDANGDGDSDGSDFLTWQRQYTGTPAVSAVSAVPEPSSVVLLGCLACPLSLIIRRVRRAKGN